jgi:hypothetical protein
MSLPGRGLLIQALLMLSVAGACSASNPAFPAVSILPGSVGPEVVLDAYLRAVVAGDCNQARKLAVATFVKGNGELCGDVHVTAYKVSPDAARPNPREAVFGTWITTTGTSDGSIHPGGMTWFFDLVQQSDGSWRLAGGGSGP